MTIYDENNNCTSCDEYIYDPHKPACKNKNQCGLCDCGWQVVSKSLAIHAKRF